MPLRPETIWALVQAAGQGRLQRVDPVPPTCFRATASPVGPKPSHKGGVSSVDVSSFTTLPNFEGLPQLPC